MKSAILTLTILMSLSAPAWATTYYVRKTGSNSNSGTSAAAAFLTVSKAITTAVAGDTVYIGAGSYSEPFTTPASGTVANRITFTADTAGTKTGDAGTVTLTYWTTNVLLFSGSSNVTFDGFKISGGQTTISFQNSSNCVLNNCTVQSFSAGGIALNNSSVTLTGCTIQSGSGDGVTAGANSTLTVSGGTIKSCTNAITVASASATATVDGVLLTSCGGAGVRVTAGNAQVSNCVMSSLNLGMSFAGTTGSIWNCTIVSNGNGIQVTAGTLTVKNNITTQVGTALSRTAGTVVHGYNLYYNNGTNYSGVSAATGDKVGNPLFVASGSNYRLQSTSPAKDAGADASSVTTTDLEASIRPCGAGWDMGAYEYGNCTSNHLRVASWAEVEPN